MRARWLRHLSTAVLLLATPFACADTDETASSQGNSEGAGAGAAGGGSAGGNGSGASGGVPDGCGDRSCSDDESCSNCEIDCGSCACGDGTCGETELCGTCPDDCGECAGDPPTVVRGPYLQSGGSDSVVVRWRTSEPTGSTVAFGQSTIALTKVVTSSDATTEHEVKLTGLSADTKYFYGFGVADAPLLGGDDDHFVVTAPEKGTAKPTRIWAIGDAGTADREQAAVRDAYLAHTGTRGTDLWLMLGDNAYDDGTDDEYQAAVFDMYPTILRNSVLWSTLGNHDGHTADSAAQSGPYYDLFTLPKQAEAGGVSSGTEAYYSFDYGQIHFVCLDSYDSDTDPDGDMITWLENDLAANSQPWLIAFWHHPPYTKGSHDSDSEGGLIDMREIAVPILEEHGVDLVLTGHSHSYERSMFLNGHYGYSDSLESSMVIDSGDGRSDGDGAYTRGATDPAGAVYIVAGSSGKISGGDLNHPAMFISLNELGSVVVDVDGSNMDVGFIDDAGAKVDWFSIVKQ
jgi:hypothetical protein